MPAQHASSEHFLSPDPTKRAKAWAGLYRRDGDKIARAIKIRAPWVTSEEAQSLVNDAFVSAQQYEPQAGFPFEPTALVTLFARRRAYSLWRKKRTRKRNRGQDTVPLDTVRPAEETDVAYTAHLPEPFLPVEIEKRISDFPRLQKLIAKELVDTPDSTSAEVADTIKPYLGRRPSNEVVDRSRAEIRRKLRPFITVITRELKR